MILHQTILKKDIVVVHIPAGASFSTVLDSLNQADLIDDNITFRLLATATGADDKIKSGTYKFPTRYFSSQTVTGIA